MEAVEGGSLNEDNDSDDDGAIKELKEEEVKKEDGEESDDENLSSVRIILNSQEPVSQPSINQVVEQQNVKDKPLQPSNVSSSNSGEKFADENSSSNEADSKF